jgi:hypothetical protein
MEQDTENFRVPSSLAFDFDDSSHELPTNASSLDAIFGDQVDNKSSLKRLLDRDRDVVVREVQPCICFIHRLTTTAKKEKNTVPKPPPKYSRIPSDLFSICITSSSGERLYVQRKEISSESPFENMTMKSKLTQLDISEEIHQYEKMVPSVIPLT